MFETSNYISSIFYHSIFIPQSWAPPPHSHWPAHPSLLPVAIYLFVIDRFVYWVGGLGVWMSLCIIYKMSPSFCVTARVPTKLPATEFGGKLCGKSLNQGIRIKGKEKVLVRLEQARSSWCVLLRRYTACTKHSNFSRQEHQIQLSWVSIHS